HLNCRADLIECLLHPLLNGCHASHLPSRLVYAIGTRDVKVPCPGTNAPCFSSYLVAPPLDAGCEAFEGRRAPFLLLFDALLYLEYLFGREGTLHNLVGQRKELGRPLPESVVGVNLDQAADKKVRRDPLEHLQRSHLQSGQRFVDGKSAYLADERRRRLRQQAYQLYGDLAHRRTFMAQQRPQEAGERIFFRRGQKLADLLAPGIVGTPLKETGFGVAQKDLSRSGARLG